MSYDMRVCGFYVDEIKAAMARVMAHGEFCDEPVPENPALKVDLGDDFVYWVSPRNGEVAWVTCLCDGEVFSAVWATVAEAVRQEREEADAVDGVPGRTW